MPGTQRKTSPQRGQRLVSNYPDEFGPEEYRQRKCAHPDQYFVFVMIIGYTLYLLLLYVEITQPFIAVVY